MATDSLTLAALIEVAARGKWPGYVKWRMATDSLTLAALIEVAACRPTR
jgi:hypothetical protein